VWVPTQVWLTNAGKIQSAFWDGEASDLDKIDQSDAAENG